MSNESARGVTLVELLLAVGIGGLVIAALALFSTRGFGVVREQTEQERTTEDARIQLERMSDAIRDARSQDLDNDGIANKPEELWVKSASDFEIVFITNLDTDAELEQVHYWLEGAELKRGVRDPLTEAEETVEVLARSLRNQDGNQPLFTYHGGAQAPAMSTPVVGLEAIRVVGIHLVVDVDVSAPPGAAVVETTVSPRATGGFSGIPSPTPTP